MITHPYFLPAAISLGLHGAALGLFLTASFSPTENDPVPIQVVWLKASPEMPKKEKSSPPFSKSSAPTSMSSWRRPGSRKKAERLDSGCSMKATRSMKPIKRNPSSLSSSLPQVSPPRVYKPLPKYPWISRKRHQEGVVCLHIITNEHGSIKRLSLAQSSGHTPLDKAAQEAVKTWTFAKTNHEFTLSISFKLKS